jgi:hypothetical protein
MAVSHLFPSKGFSKGLLLQICGFTVIYGVFAFLKQLWLGTITNEKLPYIYNTECVKYIQTIAKPPTATRHPPPPNTLTDLTDIAGSAAGLRNNMKNFSQNGYGGDVC